MDTATLGPVLHTSKMSVHGAVDGSHHWYDNAPVLLFLLVAVELLLLATLCSPEPLPTRTASLRLADLRTRVVPSARQLLIGDTTGLTADVCFHVMFGQSQPLGQNRG